MDDEPSARTAIGKILENEGHKVLMYEDAEPALANVGYTTVNLAKFDLHMPLRIRNDRATKQRA